VKPRTRVLNRAELLSEELAPDLRSRRARALDLVDAALAAIDAEATTTAALRQLAADGLDLGGCTVFAFGKAAAPMARAALAAVEVAGGVVVAREPLELPPLRSFVGGHPVPAADAPTTGRAVLDLARSLGPDDVALCLVSGGGSAMLELPRDGVELQDIVRTTRELARDGADIGELNRVRTALSRLKGGQLAEAMAPARVVNLVLSDVGAYGPELVASGPTVVPGSRTVVVADITSAIDALVARGLERIPGLLVGEARWAGAAFYGGGGGPARVRGGETTVTVTGPGRGGRNQEMVLGAAAAAYRSGLLLSFGTDGVDGSSDAAGALLDEAVMARANALGLDPWLVLRDNDSDRFFREAGGRIVTGPTGTNVADVCLFLP